MIKTRNYITQQNRYIIISLSSSPWNSPYWVSRQFLMYELASYCPVIYVTGRYYIRDVISYSYLKKRIFPSPPPFDPPSNLCVYNQPFFLPKIYKYKKLDEIIAKCYGKLIDHKFKIHNKYKVIVYIWEPWQLELLNGINPDVIIYHPYDKFEAMAKNEYEKSKIKKLENKVISLADLIITPHQKVAESINKNNVHIVHNGVFTKAFNRADGSKKSTLSYISRPRIGYIGVISSKLDFNLLLNLAQKKENYSFILMGPKIPGEWEKKKEVKLLESLDNVYFLPAVRFDNIFKYMIELDIGIMPYSLSGHAGYCESPLKMYQYWLCGLPIVSSQLPNVVDDPKLISCASNISDWLSSLENQLVNDSQQMRQYRKQVALDNSWEKKASKIIRLISEL
jgi:hypothetical protein